MANPQSEIRNPQSQTPPAFVEICNWKRAQPQMPKLGATWAKLYTSLLDHEGFARLRAADQLGVIALWLIAARTGRWVLPADPEWIMAKADFLHEPPDLATLANVTDAWGVPCPFVLYVDAPGAIGDEGGSEGVQEAVAQAADKGPRLCECGEPLEGRRRVCDACKDRRARLRRARSRKRPERAPNAPAKAPTGATNAPTGALSAGVGARSGEDRSVRNSRSVGMIQEGGAFAGAQQRGDQRRGEEIRRAKKPEEYQAAPPIQDSFQVPEREKEQNSAEQRDEPERPEDRTEKRTEPENLSNLTKPEATRPGAVYGSAGPSAARVGCEPVQNVIKFYWKDADAVAFGIAMTEILIGAPIADVRGESENTKSLVGAFAKLFWSEVAPVVPKGERPAFLEKAKDKARHAKKYGKPPGRLLTSILRKELASRSPPVAAER